MGPPYGLISKRTFHVFSPDENLAITAVANSKYAAISQAPGGKRPNPSPASVHVYDIADGRLLYKFGDLPERGIWSMIFVGEDILIGFTVELVINIYDLKTGKLVEKFLDKETYNTLLETYHGDIPIKALNSYSCGDPFIPDETRPTEVLALSSAGSSILLNICPGSSSIIRRFKPAEGAKPGLVMAHYFEKKLFLYGYGGQDNAVYMYDWDTAEIVRTFYIGQIIEGESDFHNQVWSVAVHGDNLFGSTGNGEVEVWNWKTGEFVTKLISSTAETASLDWFDKPIKFLFVTPKDPQQLVVIGYKGKIFLYSLPDLTLQKTLDLGHNILHAALQDGILLLGGRWHEYPEYPGEIGGANFKVWRIGDDEKDVLEITGFRSAERAWQWIGKSVFLATHFNDRLKSNGKEIMEIYDLSGFIDNSERGELVPL